MNAALNLTPTQVDSILKTAVESADQNEMNHLVRTLFLNYDFHQILPDDLLRRAVKIVNERHHLNLKIS